MKNKLIIETFVFIGARIGELINLNLEDLKDGGIYIRSEKNRLVPLPDELYKGLVEYISKYRMNTDQRHYSLQRRVGQIISI